jgi:SAM-dependent methyltransferase
MSIKSILKSIVPPAVLGQLKETAYRATAFRYQGDRYECVFCGGLFKKLLPRGLDHGVLYEKHVVGGGVRENAFCPRCLSYDRERLVYLYLKNCTDLLQRPSRVLHVAPERQLLRVLRRHEGLSITTGDLMTGGVDVRLDVTDIQFPENSFDLVLCNHVMEHVPDDRKAMREILRVLKPGGLALLQTPISTILTSTDEDLSDLPAAERERRFGQCDHCRIYAMDYADRLRESGYDLEIYRWADHPEHFGGKENRYALNPEEVIFAGRKPIV